MNWKSDYPYLRVFFFFMKSDMNFAQIKMKAMKVSPSEAQKRAV